MSALETLLRASLAYVQTGRVPVEAVTFEPETRCNACDPSEPGCALCSEWGDPLCGQRCPGFRGAPCESGGERLRNGSYRIASASVCLACAVAACCSDDDDSERVEAALAGMEG